MKRIIITGAAGFIAFHLAKRLADQGHYIIMVDNFWRGRKDKEFEELISRDNVEFFEVDLQDASQYDKLPIDVDEVYHLAAVNGTEYFYSVPHKLLKINLLSCINILDWFVEKGVSKEGKILFASSSETYASTANSIGIKYPTPENVFIGIEDIHNPRWSYAGSKIAGELLFINYAKKYNFKVAICRYTNAYGPRMGYKHVIPEFMVRILNKDDPFEIFGWKETRTFCYIDDVTKATQMVMESDKTDGELINIGGDPSEETTMKDLALKMISIFNINPKLKLNDAPSGCVKRRVADTSKLIKLTNYQPNVKLDEGLKKTFEWYKQNYQSKYE